VDKLTCVIMKGLPASGKSTWCAEQLEKYPSKYKIISKDKLRVMLDNGKHSKQREVFIREARNALILAALHNGYSILVDDTNLHPMHENDIRALVGDLATIEIKDFTHVDVETCIQRDSKRPNYVGEKVIRQMYRDFLQPKPPVLEFDPSLPTAIICDLDGTLALLNGRNPYDAARCEEDLVNEPVADILKTYFLNGYTILLSSGRSDLHRHQTERWLEKHSIQYNALYMRVEGDSRKDAIVKREIYEQHMQGRYTIKFVLDDRNQVVELWRSLGLTVLQVADGDF